MAIQIQACDFAATRAQARRMTDAALDWTIGDCLEAALIHDEMDREGIPNNSGRYWDQYHTFTEERARRRAQARRTA